MTMPKPPEELEIEAIELREWEADQRTPQADAALAALVKQTATPPPHAPVRRPSTISRPVANRTPPRQFVVTPAAARPQTGANTVRRLGTSPVGIPRVVAQPRAAVPAPVQVIPPREPPVSETRTTPAPAPEPPPDPPPVAVSAPPVEVAATPAQADPPRAPAAAPVTTPAAITRIDEVYPAYRIPHAPAPAPRTEDAARPNRKRWLVVASAATAAVAIIAIIALTRSPDHTEAPADVARVPASDQPAPTNAIPRPAASPARDAAATPHAPTETRTDTTLETPASKPPAIAPGAHKPSTTRLAQTKPRTDGQRLPTPAPHTDSLVQARAAYSLGNQRLFAGDAAGAIAAYRRALALSPNFAAGHRGLGLAYAQQGDKARARTAFQTYLKLAPAAKDAALIRKRIAALGG